MNVLVLTPDAVGSTLLQRLITIYMQFCNYDRPVINLHELTNGLSRYHSSAFNQEVLGKPAHKPWGYYQSLEEIVELLSTTDHYKTSRLAHYHIRNRQDSIQQQIPFYQYLNENFYIISCRRHNMFEHALSWCLSKITKKLNVYTSEEKIDSFFELYKNGIDIDPNSLLQTLTAYQDYVNWCNNHFTVANYFYYDEHLPNIERYILGLPRFGSQPRLTWKDNFDIDFNDWNQCHRIPGDLGTLALTAPDRLSQLPYTAGNYGPSEEETKFLSDYRSIAQEHWPRIHSVGDYLRLPENIRSEVETVHGITPMIPANPVRRYDIAPLVLQLLPREQRDFFNKNKEVYQKSMSKIQTMVDQGIIINSPPIKKQTLAEKKHMIRNYSQLLEVYNRWVENNPDIGQPIDASTLDDFAQAELNQWNVIDTKNQLSVGREND